MSRHLSFTNDRGMIQANVTEDGKLLGSFILDPDDEEQEELAEELGVDMKYACYAYEAATGEKPC